MEKEPTKKNNNEVASIGYAVLSLSIAWIAISFDPNIQKGRYLNLFLSPILIPLAMAISFAIFFIRHPKQFGLNIFLSLVSMLIVFISGFTWGLYQLFHIVGVS